MIRNSWFCACLCFLMVGCSQHDQSEMSGGPVTTITPDNFQAVVLESSEPVLVDCWAPWCGPCKILAPTIAELAREYEGKVKVAKMNIDENTVEAGKYQITAIPTVLLFKDGKVVANRVGVQPKANYISDIKQHTGQ